jgi:hypothetical protein
VGNTPLFSLITVINPPTFRSIPDTPLRLKKQGLRATLLPFTTLMSLALWYLIHIMSLFTPVKTSGNLKNRRELPITSGIETLYAGNNIHVTIRHP